MPFRTRAPSVKLGPVRLRFGKKGVSTSVGNNHGSVTVGPNGTKARVRVAPGITYEERLDAPRSTASTPYPEHTPTKQSGSISPLWIVVIGVGLTLALVLFVIIKLIT